MNFQNIFTRTQPSKWQYVSNNFLTLMINLKSIEIRFISVIHDFQFVICSSYLLIHSDRYASSMFVLLFGPTKPIQRLAIHLLCGAVVVLFRRSVGKCVNMKADFIRKCPLEIIYWRLSITPFGTFPIGRSIVFV